MTCALLNDFSLALAASSLRHTLTVCCSVGNGLSASSFLLVSESRIPAMMRVVSRVSEQVTHKSAASANPRKRI